ncbi:MAG: hypothetical protein AB2693_30900 [Candidatus Thiodiazotropha sp.]
MVIQLHSNQTQYQHLFFGDFFYILNYKTKQKEDRATIQVTKLPETIDKRTRSRQGTALEQSAKDYWGLKHVLLVPNFTLCFCGGLNI